MSDLVITGPPMLELKWSQTTEERAGLKERGFFPETRHQEPDGYLHGGLAAAAVLGAARLIVPSAAPVTSVAVSLERPVPLGDRLQLAVRLGEQEVHDMTIERLLPPDAEERAVEVLGHGTVRLAGYEPAPDLADVRQLALVPIPEPQEHELFARCWVCGQANPQGLQLLPGWHADGRVVTSFVADDRYVEGGGKGAVSQLVICALLSCPTLWACKHLLDARAEPGALLVDYEVRFHDEVRVAKVLRTVGFAGEPDGRYLHGMSALADEDGRIYATASATWVAVDQVPTREVGQPTPLEELMPLKAGRPEERSPDQWGQPLPGRREDPGPRSERPSSR